jgi:hypothetical protein
MNGLDRANNVKKKTKKQKKAKRIDLEVVLSAIFK